MKIPYWVPMTLMLTPLFVNLISNGTGYRETAGGTILLWACIACWCVGAMLHVYSYFHDKRLRRQNRERNERVVSETRALIAKMEADEEERFRREVERRKNK